MPKGIMTESNGVCITYKSMAMDWIGEQGNGEHGKRRIENRELAILRHWPHTSRKP